MANFNFDYNLEQADNELEDAINLLSVFWEFFCVERPLLKEKPDVSGSLWFIQSCKTYDSVLNAALDRIRAVHSDIVSAIEQYFAYKKKTAENAESGASV